MKLFILTCQQDDRKAAVATFKKAGIGAYSMADITGFKTFAPEDLSDEWFAASPVAADSLLFFSFLSETLAAKALELVFEHNQQHPSDFPLRGFVLSVDTWVN
ncbi:hypothetical protein SAMN05421780_102503 [Flexibacter flexilis DSM 6793]|uniref:Uncharacterized protein n=1 Tax=Flexibacter flexilis DSM 6793 TaxID=927664 RepID=A0A1I1G9V3_9BACT|nr:hypothetical protein [Flexibacter flexilis]SFC08176.1 hypothetical protein SAMN05421780_102503 [Flexibacter flexilis DSM 6793]